MPTLDANQRIVLDAIPFQPDFAALLEALHLAPDCEDAARVAEMLAEARAVARPKAIVRVGAIEAKDEDRVTVSGVDFTSRVLRVNLGETRRLFAFVATCGTELEAWAAGIPDLLERWWADAIMELALRVAMAAADEAIVERFAATHLAMMNPGSLPDWPLSQQRPLFALVGDPTGTIGVTLTDSLLMQPSKSVSGIRFATEGTFESCQLCPIEGCPNRRAPYDDLLYQRKYAAGD